MLPFVVRRAIARMRLAKLTREKGEDSLAARAAKGRVLFYDRQVPEKILADVKASLHDAESIAWHRVAETRPGFMNRSQRKFYAR